MKKTTKRHRYPDFPSEILQKAKEDGHSSDVLALFDQVAQNLQKEDYVAATPLAAKLALALPGNADALFLHAFAIGQGGDVNTASKILDSAKEIAKTKPNSWLAQRIRYAKIQEPFLFGSTDYGFPIYDDLYDPEFTLQDYEEKVHLILGCPSYIPWLNRCLCRGFSCDVLGFELCAPSDRDIEIISQLVSIRQLFSTSAGVLSDAGLVHLQKLPRLEYVCLDSHAINERLTDRGLAHLAAIQRLRRLEMHGNSITDTGVRYISTHMSDLDLLGLNETLITDTSLNYLLKMKRLRGLRLSETSITDEGLGVIGEFKTLTELGISKTNITASGLSRLKNIHQLKSLDLSSTAIDDGSLVFIRKATQLERLDLGSVKISDDGLLLLDELSELKVLKIDSTPISDKGMEAISKMTKLERLSLFSTKITNAGLSSLKNLNELKYLSLAFVDNISEKGVLQLCHLPNLQELIIPRHLSADLLKQRFRQNKSECSVLSPW